MSSKKWVTICIALVAGVLILWGGITIVVDPFFHYHKPNEKIRYVLSDERYINDGIIRHFEYDAMIIGSSMTQNFKTSEYDRLFETNSIKVPFSGASHRELSMAMEQALSHNEDLNRILLCIDGNDLTQDCRYMRYSSYPDYLYNDFYWDDIAYIFSKYSMYHGVLNTLIKTMSGAESDTFDEYSSFDRGSGSDVVCSNYQYLPVEQRPEQREITEEELLSLQKTFIINFVQLFRQYPDVEFDIFFPPYSIAYFNGCSEKGILQQQFQAYTEAAAQLLQCDNVRLYCFLDRYDIICDLTNYSDTIHYTQEINSEILQWIHDDEGRITRDNYESYFERVGKYYMEYDYSIFETIGE